MSTGQINHTIDADTIQQESSASEPYPPSFIDRFMALVERLPVPYWLTYLALFILQSIAFHILAWTGGGLPAYTFNSLILLYPLWLWGPFAITTYLNSISLKALSSFSALLDVQPETMRRFQYEFTTMPARNVIISGVFWSAIYFIFQYISFDTVYAVYRYGTLAKVITVIEGLITFFIGSEIYYHSIHQLRLVNRTVKMVEQFDLFRLDPVYAFSAVTSRTAACWVILLSLTLLITPIQIAFVPTLTMLIVQVVLAIAAFFLPLWSVNQRLVTEKHRLQAELDQRVKAVLAQMHRALDDNELGGLAQLNSALNGLNAERDILEKIPTWPWRVSLFTRFLSVVVLPIILFLTQRVLANWLDK